MNLFEELKILIFYLLAENKIRGIITPFICRMTYQYCLRIFVSPCRNPMTIEKFVDK